MLETDSVSYRTCPLCEATCGLKITHQAGVVKRIAGDPDDIFSAGFICPKGAVLGALHHDPDRLQTPLVRRDGELVPASWEEAFDVIDSRLKSIREAHGRDAVAIYLGNPNVHGLAGQLYLKPLIQAFRTKNLYTASTIDQMPMHVACGLVFGDPDAIPVPDLDRTDFLLMLGANPLASNGSLCTAPDFPGRLKALRARGGRLVVVDPKRTRTAERADQHLFIRPGADALLLFALVHALFAEDRVTPSAHIEEADVQAIQTLATPFSPEAVAVATGIDAATIWALARALAVTHKAAVYCRIGACTVEFGTLTNWLTLVLNALTGNLDQVGGLMFPKPFFRGEATRAKQFRMGRWSSRVRGYPEVRGELPIATLADEITTPGEGRVRALVTVAGNPTLSAPDSQRLTDALGELDFMVSVDLYRNETSRHADVVLPVPSALERSHADLAFANLSVRNVVNYSPALFPLPPGLRHEHEILTRLAMSAAGAGANKPTESFEDFALAYLVNAEVSASSSPLQGRKVGAIIAALGTERGPERILDFLLRAGPYGDHFGTRSDGWTLERLRETPHGVDFGALTPALPGRLRTKSGRVELLPDAISTDVGRLRTSLETPREPGFRLIGRRHLRSNNSWMHNLPPLVKGKPRCTLQIHPADVARLGLSELAVVTSRVGRLLVPVEPTDRMMPGVVSLPHGWGHDVEGSALSVAREHGGVNSNELTDPLALDPLSGNAVLNGIPVTIVPG